MSPDLQQKLFEDFPEFFRDKNLTIYQSCMPWGIEVGDGWYQIIYDMCTKIKQLNPPESFRFSQVKEKFGFLRIYSIGDDEEIYKVIMEAENASDKTCEDCGSTEDVWQAGSWVRTLCQSCWDKREGI